MEEMRKTFAPPWRQEQGRKATAKQRAARDAQVRAARAAEEEGKRLRSEEAASGRRLRGLGRQQLAFQGSERGVASTLGG